MCINSKKDIIFLVKALIGSRNRAAANNSYRESWVAAFLNPRIFPRRFPEFVTLIITHLNYSFYLLMQQSENVKHISFCIISDVTSGGLIIANAVYVEEALPRSDFLRNQSYNIAILSLRHLSVIKHFCQCYLDTINA